MTTNPPGALSLLVEAEPPLVQQWMNGVSIGHVAHQRAAAHYRRLHGALGIPATIFSVIVGTSVFAALAATEQKGLLLVAGATSILAAVLSGLQTFLDYGGLASEHQAAAGGYGRLRRRIEESIVTAGAGRVSADLLSSIRQEWDGLDVKAPLLPQAIHDAAVEHVLRRAQRLAAARREPSGAPATTP